MTQEELLQGIKRKDDKAFTHLYDVYAKSLFAVISNTVRSRADAEAALEETFVRIWKNIDSYSEKKGRFYTWMLNIARKTASDKIRTTDHKNTTGQNFVHLHDDNNFAGSRIDAIGIREFVKKLKPKCIQIIELLYFRGMSQREAADILEIPVESVKTNNRYCINDLRNYLHQ